MCTFHKSQTILQWQYYNYIERLRIDVSECVSVKRLHASQYRINLLWSEILKRMPTFRHASTDIDHGLVACDLKQILGLDHGLVACDLKQILGLDHGLVACDLKHILAHKSGSKLAFVEKFRCKVALFNRYYHFYSWSHSWTIFSYRSSTPRMIDTTLQRVRIASKRDNQDVLRDHTVTCETVHWCLRAVSRIRNGMSLACTREKCFCKLCLSPSKPVTSLPVFLLMYPPIHLSW